MKIINKFLTKEDFKLISYSCIREKFEYIYKDIFKKEPETYGSIYQDQTKIHWSRDWEYPWAIINSEVKAGEKVLDCGCGGSPLLPFLAKYGCQVYGVDPNIFEKMSLSSHLFEWSRNAAHQLLVKKDFSLSGLKFILKSLKRENKLWGFIKDPNELGFKIKFFAESLDKMHFKNNFFDKVFCISVVEHLKEKTAYKGMKEMARVLKKGGLLVVTVDHDNDGPQINPKLKGAYEKLIRASGLKLYGKSKFKKPNPKEVPGTYNVIGFILKKDFSS